MISALAAQQMNRSSTPALFPALIQLTYEVDGVQSILRIVNNTEDLVYEGNTFNAAQFSYTPPKYVDKKMGNASITISAVSQEVIVIIRTITTRAKAKVVAAFYYEDGDLHFEPIEEWDFELAKVDWDEAKATWELVFDDNMTLITPCHRMTALRCPGIA